jgi:MFS family permease
MLHAAMEAGSRRRAVHFVLLVGVLSFFADFTYEGARSVLGPYLLSLGVSATIVGIVTGMGEMLGYGLRLLSGRWADATGKFWPITILGYVVQMASVPALALTQNWREAAVLIVLERIGKAIRNPPRDVMLSHAAQRVGGYGLVFGLHEAMDQLGALVGPLLVAAVLAGRGSYRSAFAMLLIPAVMSLCVLGIARWLYPRPQDLETAAKPVSGHRLPGVFWIYLAGAALVAAGFADYPLIAYHLAKTQTVPGGETIAIFYAAAMAASGASSLVFGRLFDRWGFSVLVGLTILTALFAPLVFLGGFWAALLGAILWGMGMGVHESIIPAAVAPMVPATRRASAFGLFTAGYGLSWFAGSSIIGILYDISPFATTAFCLLVQLVAVLVFIHVGRRRSSPSAPY